MIRLTTHVLDTARGAPAAGMAIELFAIETDGRRRSLARATTDADGRTGAPIGSELAGGIYELVFDAGSYFAAHDTATFYSEIAIRFTVDSRAAHYHVPLLIAPWGYSTYRGS